MAKSLDSIDEHILRLLRDDARLPLSTLARRIGLSRSAAQERLQRLEHHGIIAGYTIKLRPPDRTALSAYLFLKFAAGYACADVVPHLRAHSQLRMCHSLAGPIDLVLLAETATSEDLYALRERLMTIPGVAEINTAPVLTAHFG